MPQRLRKSDRVPAQESRILHRVIICLEIIDGTPDSAVPRGAKRRILSEVVLFIFPVNPAVHMRDSRRGKRAVGDLAVLSTEKVPRLRVVSAVTAQQVSLIDFGDEDGEIEFLRDRAIKVAR